MQTILVTGGAGFIGANFVRYLLKVEPHACIINLDALTYAGSLENLNEIANEPRHIFVRGDISDRAMVEALFEQYVFDTVIHFAAETHVDRSIVDPEPFIRANVFGTFTLLEAARKTWNARGGFAGCRFHHVSTDEVYGSLAPSAAAFTETTSYDPRSPYSATKAASDHLVRAYFHTYGLPVTLTNCSNNYGPLQFPEKLIPLMIRNALQGQPLPVYGDGKQIRDWLYVEDHCDAIYRVAKDGQSGETYNVGGGNQPYNIDLVNEICAILDELRPQAESYTRLITHVPDRPGHDRRYAMDISKIRAELDWMPRHDIESGLRATVRWYLDHGDWIEAVSQKSDYDAWIKKNYEERK